MCTFENDHRVLVCDLAIPLVRAAVSAAFGDAVQLTLAPGQGTLIEAGPSIDGEAFQDVTRSAIAAAQEKPDTHPDQEQEKL